MLVSQATTGKTGEEGVEIGTGGSGVQATVLEVEGRGAAVTSEDGVTGLRV